MSEKVNQKIKSGVDSEGGAKKMPDAIGNRAKFHTISLLVANKPGVLIRIALVFSRRGYNLESLVVSPALDGRFSRMTLMCSGDNTTLDQIVRQLHKLVDVIHATEHQPDDSLEQELALIKVKATSKVRPEILQLAEHFKSESLDFSQDTLIIKVTGTTEKLDSFVSMLKPYGIIEIVRTGKILMSRGKSET